MSLNKDNAYLDTFNTLLIDHIIPYAICVMLTKSSRLSSCPHSTRPIFSHISYEAIVAGLVESLDTQTLVLSKLS